MAQVDQCSWGLETLPGTSYSYAALLECRIFTHQWHPSGKYLYIRWCNTSSFPLILSFLQFLLNSFFFFSASTGGTGPSEKKVIINFCCQMKFYSEQYKDICSEYLLKKCNGEFKCSQVAA